MKKRLLITSIVMMLVVAVALGTSTYAWFTSNTTVSATEITMIASTSNTAALAVGWVPGEGEISYGSQITTTPIGNDVTFDPVAPTTIAANTAIGDFTFGTGKIQTLSNRNYFSSVTAATAAENNASVYKWTGVASDSNPSNIISIKNTSNVTTTRNVTITANFGADIYVATQDVALVPGKTYYTLNETVYSPVASPVVANIGTYYEKTTENTLIRIAVFKLDTATSTYKLVGIMGSAAETIAWGAIATPANAASPSEYETAEVKMHISGDEAESTPVTTTAAVVGSTGLALGTIAPASDIKIKVVVWMDGQALGDNQGGLKSSISLTFTEDAQ